MSIEVVVVGGSFAGMAAALQLVRARQRVVVVDAGLRRNRFAASSHGFLTQDGRAPSAIVADARAQLLAYPQLRWIDGVAQSARVHQAGFEVVLDDEVLVARRLVLATGVVDELPAVSGLAERWGRSVFHCPYCHGHELALGRIGVLASNALAMHQALMLPDWGEVTLLLNSAFEPDASQLAALAARGVVVEREGVERIEGDAVVALRDGRRLAFAGLFTASRTHMASPLAEQLGCEFEAGPTGAIIRRNELMETSVAGVFACGDAARMAGNVALAVGDGTWAGVSVHRSLMFGLSTEVGGRVEFAPATR